MRSILNLLCGCCPCVRTTSPPQSPRRTTTATAWDIPRGKASSQDRFGLYLDSQQRYIIPSDFTEGDRKTRNLVQNIEIKAKDLIKGTQTTEMVKLMAFIRSVFQWNFPDLDFPFTDESLLAREKKVSFGIYMTLFRSYQILNLRYEQHTGHAFKRGELAREHWRRAGTLAAKSTLSSTEPV